MDDVPGNWPELFELVRADAEGEEDLASLEELVGKPSPFLSIGVRLQAPASLAARRALLLGPESESARFERIRQHVPRALSELQPLDEDRLDAAVALLTWLNVARCSGMAATPEENEAEFELLRSLAPHAPKLDDDKQLSMALLGAATGLTPLVPTLLEAELPAEVEPVQTFVFDYPGFALYMAAAHERRMTSDDVKPAWQSFVAAFPIQLTAHGTDWPDLLAASRIYYTLFENLPVEGVTTRLRAYLQDGFL